MKKIILILLLFTGLMSNGQSVQIDTLKFSKEEESGYSQTFNFPVIKTLNEKINTEINQYIKNRFAENDLESPISDSIFIRKIKENLTSLDFEVTFNKNEVLSFNITAEGCGAYCTTWTEYFNYSTSTGNRIEINDIIDFSGSFKEKVLKDISLQYSKEKSALKKMRDDVNSGLDEETYKWALEYYEGCESSFKATDIALHSDYLEIIHECHLPRMIMALTPVIELKYKYQDIKEYLKLEISE